MLHLENGTLEDFELGTPSSLGEPAVQLGEGVFQLRER